MLKFICGTMGSAKTASALMRYFELKTSGYNVVLMKPCIDDRDGADVIKSRIGLEEKAIVFDIKDNLSGLLRAKKLHSVIIDEVQFCTAEQINMLKLLSIKNNVKVYCYGLKTDFTSHLFEGSKRLLEIADSVEELEMSCKKCGEPAQINARVDKMGNIIREGEQIELGANDKYQALCYKCWVGEELER